MNLEVDNIKISLKKIGITFKTLMKPNLSFSSL